MMREILNEFKKLSISSGVSISKNVIYYIFCKKKCCIYPQLIFAKIVIEIVMWRPQARGLGASTTTTTKEELYTNFEHIHTHTYKLKYKYIYLHN